MILPTAWPQEHRELNRTHTSSIAGLDLSVTLLETGAGEIAQCELEDLSLIAQNPH